MALFLNRLSLRVKAMLLVSVIILLALGGMATVTVRQFNQYIAAEHRGIREATAQNFALACELPLAVHDRQELERLAQRFARDEQVTFVAVYDSDNAQLAVAGRMPSERRGADRPDAGPDLLVARATVHLRFSPEQFDVFADEEEATGLTDEATSERPIGHVVVGSPAAPLRAAQTQQAMSTVGITLLAVLVATGVMFATVSIWTRRLENLVTASERISQGHLDDVITSDATDEIGSLATGLEQMRQAVKLRDHELRQWNETLQERVTQRTRALSESEARMRGIVESAANGIITIDHEGHITLFNPHAEQLFGYTADEALGQRFEMLLPQPYRLEAGACLIDCERTGETRRLGSSAEILMQHKDGTQRPVHVAVSEVELEDRRLQTVMVQDISDRKRAEQERDNMHRKLLASSRQAGMAEVATGVLHNVGNVLNSVNVAANLVADRLRESRIENLGKVSDLLRSHSSDLGAFLEHDERGRHLPDYLIKLTEHLTDERQQLLEEVGGLAHNLEHIKKVVATQQAYARVAGVAEWVQVEELVEDALRINAAGLERHGVTLVREYQPVPSVEIDKHKVLQIVVNLVSNAKYAMEHNTGQRQLTVRVHAARSEAATPGQPQESHEPAQTIETVQIDVCDNGSGIEPENLTRIFSHGFTTRKDGHGFGLHSGALTAKELGGSLTAHSDGPGHGSTFTLTLPVVAQGNLDGTAARSDEPTHSRRG